MKVLVRKVATIGCLSALPMSVGALFPDFIHHAQAHDVVVGGSPADGEVIDGTPRRLVLEFSAEPKEGFNSMALTDQNRTIITSGEPEVDGRLVSLDMPSDLILPPGAYTIGFQITSSDGHSTRGKTTFTVQGTASGAPSTTPEITAARPSESAAIDPADTTSDSQQWWLWLLGVVALSAIIVALAIARQRQRNKGGKPKNGR
ncbi:MULTISPECIES: copper resistance CopC family protein [unclassified Corynebacterium]|uniref:copper resistance CopC family protein n=1 Tax=unclassified Corynebacterium TaxID=2624378 RepID=UPI002168C36C|nr:MULTISPECIES: copper resistance CopC family protein [unclassified Corynebacterium]MCS4489211.1 copper resistance protein CopC [Corynebacterium sp. ES2775-CONJ]MCS4491024.1 copper resistance protein CopC [Corynebacterium sp. ES2715-CONJ3]MCS4531095.1 copper resistance protein CopC [Corynebacterium sp. ES2730-CONJ]